jgi:hypothetical protein
MRLCAARASEYSNHKSIHLQEGDHVDNVRFLSSNFGFLLVFLGAIWWGTHSLATWIGVLIVVIGALLFVFGLSKDIINAVKGGEA